MERPEWMNKLKQGWQLVTSVTIFLTFALTLSVSSGYSYGSTLLVAGALAAFCIKPKRFMMPWSREDKWLLWTFIIYGLSFLFFRCIHVFELTGLDKPSRFIIAFFPYLFLRRYPVSIRAFWYGIAVGALSGCAVGLYQKIILDADRSNGFQHPIMFGDLGVLFGLLSFAGVIYFVAMHDRKSILFMGLAGVAGLFTSALSGSRGGWIAIPMALLYIFWQSRELIGRTRAMLILISFVVLAGIVIAIPQTNVYQRIDDTITNVQAYISGENAVTSSGERFEMWKAAFYLFKKAPILGVGKYDLQVEKQILANQGLINSSVVQYGHAHNEYLTNLSEYGIIGLILLLFVYGVPLRLFVKQVRYYASHWQYKSVAMAGVLVPVCFMDFALTQSMFSHNSGVMIYILSIITIWSILRNLSD
ncbi:O-antigen ligase family protein [Celerinatantimonas sp. YJH-8]|uniref:O-antigen ligase family protein n=1 Tax=Celerinatantimonas sp. YJH-8 TaxID=3228714 RepID=UPI0038C12AD3